MPDISVAVRVCGGRYECLASRRAPLYELVPVGVFPVATLRAERNVPPVRMRAALAAASKRRWQESPGDLYRFARVKIDVYATAGRLAAQQADILAVGLVIKYLFLGNPQRLPARPSRVLLSGGYRDHGHAAADERSGSAAAFLRAHAAPSSGVQSVRATLMAASISASSAKPAV